MALVEPSAVTVGATQNSQIATTVSPKIPSAVSPTENGQTTKTSMPLVDAAPSPNIVNAVPDSFFLDLDPVTGNVSESISTPVKSRPIATIAPECDVMPQAVCRNIDLRGLDLFYANFQGADLTGANLSGMDLTGVDFSRANLSGANLTGTTLDYGVLFGADLTGAQLARSSMSDIIWDDTTIWPTDFVPPDY